jgi:hypothetical protein
MTLSAIGLVFGLLLAFGCGLAGPASAGTYKWVDDKGVTHYGDSIPPEFKDKANAELNKRGITIRKTEEALTPEQIRARQEQEAHARDEDAKARELKRRDQALLQTFTTERDIDLKRDRDLQQIELSIANNQSVLKNTEKRLAESHARADSVARSGRPLPDGLKQDIENDEAVKAKLEGLIAQRREESGAVRTKYEDYKRRFIELQGGAAAAAKAPVPGASLTTPAAAAATPVSASALRK